MNPKLDSSNVHTDDNDIVYIDVPIGIGLFLVKKFNSFFTLSGILALTPQIHTDCLHRAQEEGKKKEWLTPSSLVAF